MPDSPRRRTGLTVVVGALVAGLVAGLAWWLAGGEPADAPVVARPADPSSSPAASPGALTVSVRAPDRVVAGRSARFVVGYRDGEGIFSGGTEDWGDVGVGSVRQAACTASTPSAAPVAGSYAATHRWREPGHYPVTVSVTTYTCRADRAVTETATARLTVVVAPR